MRHVPRPRLKAPDTRRQGTDGAEVDDVPAEVRLQGLVELAGDERLHAALVSRQLLLPCDLVVVTRAPVAQHASLAVERDFVGERDRLLEVQARAVDPAGGVAMPEREVLQRAFAALVAYGAVERMVGELELEDVRARLDGHRALRPDDHPLRNGRRARRLGARGAGGDGHRGWEVWCQQGVLTPPLGGGGPRRGGGRRADVALVPERV